MQRKWMWLAFLLLVLAFPLNAQKSKKNKRVEKDTKMTAKTFQGLKARLIGPAMTEGRISDFAVHPDNRAIYYVAVSSGGVWKTENAGTTWSSIFDGQGSYSIGCVTLDPNNPLTVWVGSGENNSQRSVGYGDGVYKSTDGGKSWKNMGLKQSEHIAKIVVDPRNSNRILVASQGPLWSDGGDRGLFESTDGGKTWKAILEISPQTGITDLVLDPRDPDVLYAASYQRRRHTWTLIDGGPESAIHKSTDGGKSWKKIVKGLPSVQLGRIGLAIPPTRPDTVYAIVEAAQGKDGFYRSQNGGETWQKKSSYISSSPQYYQELVCHPTDADTVYSLDTWTHVTKDGGASFKRVGERYKHVDNHALWIDPKQPNYFLSGCDGGIYESFDGGKHWLFKANLPITQFYKIAVDNDLPFYNVYGGTQDNYTLGGPSRTTTVHGITNADWFVTLGGDGFEPQVDPTDPNLVYTQYQYGNLYRFDKRSGEQLLIKPQEGKDDPPLRWNWDAPLLISPHNHKRLFFAANVLFQSDDRGHSWRAISGDLTRNLDRNQLEVMGRVWSVDAVSKNRSTSFFGNIVALSESPLTEGLLLVGTDDGLIQISQDGGNTWSKTDRFPGVPDMAYAGAVATSRYDANVMFAGFNNHKKGDFKPYLLRSADQGKSWASVAGNLPERGSVYCFAEDHVNRNLWFAGTEFGLYFTLDGGKNWVQLSSGLPTVAVRDIAIQEREHDLVIGTFGRSIYILDDYSPLRDLTPESLESESTLFPVRRAWSFMKSDPMGGRKKAFRGDGFYLADNPPHGAVFTYYLPESLKTRAQTRRDREKEIVKKGGDQTYPSWEDLKLEDREEKPAIILTVTDEAGNVVRRITGPTKAGFHRVAWDLRYPAPNPINLKPSPPGPFSNPPTGPLALPGTYTVSAVKRVQGKTSSFGEARSFQVEAIANATLPAADKAGVLAFQKKTAHLQRAVYGAQRVVRETQNRINHLAKAILTTPKANQQHHDQLMALETRLKDLGILLNGNRTIAARNEPVPPSISGRLRSVTAQWFTTSAPTKTQEDAYAIAAEEFAKVLNDLRALVDTDLNNLEKDLDAAAAPWTPGRLPDWQPQ